MKTSEMRIKMCGMTRLEDVDCAIKLGVHALGFIFYPKSPRYLSIDKAKTIINQIPPFITRVAVVANPDYAWVADILRELPIDLVQFHGTETEVFCSQFKKPYIKAIHPKSAQDIEDALLEYDMASALLLDTPSENLYGGTGRSFNWNIIPQKSKKPLILSGGLNHSNIREASQHPEVFALDICSSIELTPGIKDHYKMKQLTDELWGVHD